MENCKRVNVRLETTKWPEIRLLLQFNDPTLQPECAKTPLLALAWATLLVAPVQLLGEKNN